MKLEEKIEKELKNSPILIEHILSIKNKKEFERAYAIGFRAGFRRGYNLACEEAAEMLKESRKKFEKP